ncbi:hypothetical protein [Sphingomonas sp. GC_Shp_1]|uniref:hypothetical protein n=3 Tax=unclassified Sphingomonas TaxID=196159 RepID=UPI00226BAA6E|nr:hypothetical protein [Sphingomonas sp. GC_Shp_1]
MTYMAPDAVATASLADHAMAMALADELVAITAKLADMAYELGADPATLRRHMHTLQQVDEITQVQLIIADLLRTEDLGGCHLSRVGISDLAQRLQCSYEHYSRAVQIAKS